VPAQTPCFLRVGGRDRAPSLTEGVEQRQRTRRGASRLSSGDQLIELRERGAVDTSPLFVITGVAWR
jgi:hypothetical protein